MPTPDATPVTCSYCGEELRQDVDGDWMDRETHTTCSKQGSARRPIRHGRKHAPVVSVETLASLRQEHARLQVENAKLEAREDAFSEGKIAALDHKPRETNPYNDGDSLTVYPLWLAWRDGFDCCSNRALKVENESLKAQLTALQHAQEEGQKALRGFVRLLDGWPCPLHRHPREGGVDES